MVAILLLLGFTFVATLAVLRIVRDHKQIMKDFKEEK